MHQSFTIYLRSSFIWERDNTILLDEEIEMVAKRNIWLLFPALRGRSKTPPPECRGRKGQHYRITGNIWDEMILAEELKEANK